jgi:Cu+-exporting ATPase
MNQTVEQSQLKQSSLPECYHCGEPCPGHSITIDEKYFCCEGCKIVYSILDENGLCNYYDLNKVAGISQKMKSKQEYAFLDDSETINRLISYVDDTQTKVLFYIPQIHCSSCLWLLEKLHLLNDGILSSRVDFLKKEVQVAFDQTRVSLREVVEILAMIGYAPHIQLNDLDSGNKPVTEKALYYKLGLAGFAFGNIMLLSFPEYLGLGTPAEGTFHAFFGYINLALILPVVLYSGQDYLRSAWQGLKQRHLNIDVPVSLGILALFFRSTYEILSQTGAGYMDSLAGLIFFLLIGKWFQQTTYARIAFDRDFKSYFPIACTMMADGLEKQVTLDKLEQGDLVLIRHGELIPADALLVRGKAKIDYSFVTGEAALIEKGIGDRLFAGGRQMGGIIEISVTKKVSNSYLTQLWNDHAFTKANEKGKANVIADRVAGFFTWAILIIASITLFYWLPRDVAIAVNAFTAVLIVACPCAVALSIPFTFGNVVRVFARKGIYFKNVQVIEALAQISHVVFDKTGTITNVQSAQLKYDGSSLSDYEKSLVYSLARHSTHPLSRQIETHLCAFQVLPVFDFREVKGKGISGTIDGHFIRIGSQQFINDSISDAEGKKQSVYIEIDHTVKGSFLQENEYRNGLSSVLSKIQKWGHISLLSGDHDAEKENLLPLFGSSGELHFEQKPEQKLEHIKHLQEDFHHIAMIGDGLNDAGALSQSNVGIVITEDTSNFTPACDVIMDAKNFEKLPKLFSFSRLSIKLVYAAYLIALIYNIVGLSFAVRGALSPVIAAILMPLSSVSIVLFGVGASTYFAYRKGLF